jgi:hypothetical protein
MAGEAAELLLTERRYNTVIGWAIVGVLALAALGSFLNGENAWTVFIGGIVILCVIPPFAFRNREVMLPWELIGMAALPIFGRLVATFEPFRDLHLYLSIAALALILAVEVDLFTPVKMTVGFATGFVALGTLASAGAWAVFRWSADQLLGTHLLLDPTRSTDAIHDELMIEFVYALLAGIFAGIIFELYFRRQARIRQRIPKVVRK